MQIRVLSITPPRKSSTLAMASVEITLEGHTVTISDLRILKNNQGQTWVALPSYSVQQGKGYEYRDTVALDRALRRAVEDTVLAAYEQQQAAPAQADGAR